MNKTITLNMREIFDLAEMAGFDIELANDNDLEAEITVYDMAGNALPAYRRGAYYSEYPEEGITPLTYK